MKKIEVFVEKEIFFDSQYIEIYNYAKILIL